MKSAILAATLASVAAFAPSQVAQTSTALNGAFDNEVGAASPWGPGEETHVQFEVSMI